MFKKLHRARPSRQEPLTETQHGMLGLAIPLDIFYKIVDEYGQELMQDNGRSLRALAFSCRALAAHCRPLLFHSVTLFTSDVPIPPTSRGPVTRPEAFSRLVRACPSSASLVQELQILVIKPYYVGKEWYLRKIGIEVQQKEIKAWRGLFKTAYPRLAIMRVNISWRNVSPILTKSFFKALKQMPILETLELDCDGISLEDVFQSLPPSLKHCSLLGSYIICDPPRKWVHPSSPDPTLESLTLAPYLHPTWLSSVLLSESPPFNLSTLRHLQTRLYDLAPEFPRLHNTPSTTRAALRCLHMSLGDDAFGLDLFSMADLRVLTHVEIIIEDVWSQFLRPRTKVLDSLERSMESLGALSSSEVVSRLGALSICFLFPLSGTTQLPSDNMHDWHLAAWELTLRTQSWPYLELTNLIAFSRAIHYNATFPGHFVDVDSPRILQVPGSSSTVTSYESLWKSCGCSGWKCY
jgi:hypothetical protein